MSASAREELLESDPAARALLLPIYRDALDVSTCAVRDGFRDASRVEVCHVHGETAKLFIVHRVRGHEWRNNQVFARDWHWIDTEQMEEEKSGHWDEEAGVSMPAASVAKDCTHLHPGHRCASRRKKDH